MVQYVLSHSITVEIREKYGTTTGKTRYFPDELLQNFAKTKAGCFFVLAFFLYLPQIMILICQHLVSIHLKSTLLRLTVR